MSTIGQRIKRRREDLRINSAELARLIGIKGPSLWQIEHGVTKSLRGTTLDALCEHLHTTADYLLKGSGDANGTPDALQLFAMEAELLYAIRTLNPDKRIALMEFARHLLGQQPAKQDHGDAGKRASIRQLHQSPKR